MALLDAEPSSPVRRAVAARHSRRAVQRAGASQPADESRPSGVGASLDPMDRLILSMERRAPGPHHIGAGISLESYLARLRRLVYDHAANEYAPAVMARLRVELTSGTASPNRY